MTHFELLQYILDNGELISPLMLAPWVRNSIFRVDWLHAADQGCTADFLGNILLLIASKLPGANKKARVDNLWTRTMCSCWHCILEFYVFYV